MQRRIGRVKFFLENNGYIINDERLDVSVQRANVIPPEGRRNKTIFDGDAS